MNYLDLDIDLNLNEKVKSKINKSDFRNQLWSYENVKTYKMILSLSKGDTTVLLIAPAVPPAMKYSSKWELVDFGFVGLIEFEAELEAEEVDWLFEFIVGKIGRGEFEWLDDNILDRIDWYDTCKLMVIFVENLKSESWYFSLSLDLVKSLYEMAFNLNRS